MSDVFTGDGVKVAPADMAAAVAMALVRMRVRASNERELQNATEKVLEELACHHAWHNRTPVGPMPVRAKREVSLADELGRNAGRVDFLIGDVALELKEGLRWQRADVIRQVAGYLRDERVKMAIVAATRPSLLSLWPDTLVGKRVLLVHLRRFP